MDVVNADLQEQISPRASRPVGRNDTLLIKLSILSVVALVENPVTHGSMCFFNKANFQINNIIHT